MFSNMPTKLELLEELARAQGVLRPADLRRRNLPTAYLGRLVQAGRLVRRTRGVYAPVDAEIGTYHDWELACLRVPQGVLCLTTALMFHEIGTQSPRVVWMAIDGKAWEPRIEYPPIRFVRISGAALDHGVMNAASGKTTLRVTTAAKTVADCFKFRRKLGLDMAVEALREGWRERKFTMADLAAAARVCRVSRVMQPYLEMLP
jgi:predicted transcriptional regulator of viral defense system